MFVIKFNHEYHTKHNEEYILKYEEQMNKKDAGVDLFIPEDIIIEPNTYSNKINHHTSAKYYSNSWYDMFNKIYSGEYQNYSYRLVPRSSIVKTNLRMSNSIGIIDLGYTGNLIACVDNTSSEQITIKAGTSLFQIIPSDSNIIQRIEILDIYEHPDYDSEYESDDDNNNPNKRGTQGFGSTGNTIETSNDKEKYQGFNRNEQYDKVVNEYNNNLNNDNNDNNCDLNLDDN